MKKRILAVLVAVATLGVLIGCAGGAGKPRGPVDAFVFAAGTNPGLEQNAVGSLNMQKDPLEIYVVVPPDTDLRRLVATFSLNVEAMISTISSGAKVIQQNGVTPNDFSAPVNYTVEVPKDKKPWRYRVTVRLAETNPRLAQLALGDGAVLTPSFSAKVKSYSVTVPFATTKVKVDARGESQYLKSITIDGAAANGPARRDPLSSPRGRRRHSLSRQWPRTGSPAMNTRSRSCGVRPTGTPTSRASRLPTSRWCRASRPCAATTRRRCPSTPRSSCSRPGRRASSRRSPSRRSSSRARSSRAGRSRPRATPPTRTAPRSISPGQQARRGRRRHRAGRRGAGVPRRRRARRARARQHPGSCCPSRTAAWPRAFVPAGLSYVVEVPFAIEDRLTVVAQFRGQVREGRARAGPRGAAGHDRDPLQGRPRCRRPAPIFDFSPGDRLSLAAAVTAQDGKVLRYFLDVRRMPPDSNADLSGIAISAGILSPLFTPRMVSYTVSLPSNIDTVKLTLTTASAVATVTRRPARRAVRRHAASSRFPRRRARS